MAAFIVFDTNPPSYSGYRTQEEALSQARHDLTQPGHVDPLRIVSITPARMAKGDVHEAMANAKVLVERAGIEERPCDCKLCEWHLKPHKERLTEGAMMEHPYAG